MLSCCFLPPSLIWSFSQMLGIQGFPIGLSVSSFITGLGLFPQPCFHHSHGLGHMAALLMGSSAISHKPRPRGDIQSILSVYLHPAKAVKLSGIIVPSSYVHEKALSKDIDQFPNDLMAQQVETLWFAARKPDHSNKSFKLSALKLSRVIWLEKTTGYFGTCPKHN